MLVRNKKTKREQEITPDAWQQMQEKDIANRFTVVRAGAEPVPVKKEIIVPEEVKQLRNKKNKNTAK